MRELVLVFEHGISEDRSKQIKTHIRGRLFDLVKSKYNVKLADIRSYSNNVEDKTLIHINIQFEYENESSFEYRHRCITYIDKLAIDICNHEYDDVFGIKGTDIVSYMIVNK